MGVGWLLVTEEYEVLVEFHFRKQVQRSFLENQNALALLKILIWSKKLSQENARTV